MRKLDVRSDIKGQSFNGVRAIDATSKIKQKGKVFKFLCFCGKEFEEIVWKVKSGKKKSCGCLFEKNKFKQGRITSEYDQARFIKGKFREYKSCSKRKNRIIPFQLTLEEFTKITKQNCYYCDAVPYSAKVNKGQTYVYSGLFMGVDRKDDLKGYSLDNCVPCCSTCNMMKKNMSVEEFTRHAIKIAEKVAGSLKK